MARKFTQEDLYIGKQIIIDSDRLVFNGREELTKFEKSISQDKRILNIKADMQS